MGFHLAKNLSLNKDCRVVLADNFFRAKKDKDLEELLKNNSNIDLLEVDLTLQEDVEKLGRDYDEVYHFAAINGTRNFYEIPDKVLRVDVLSVINILDWFLKNKKKNSKIVFSSSSETYAGTKKVWSGFPIPTPEKVPLCIEDISNPRWSYGGSKIIGELFFINYAKVHKIRMSIVRFHNVFGPRMGYGHVVPEFFERIAKKETPFVIFGGKETRSFCYVDDMIEAVKLVMETDKTDNEIINIGNDKEEITIKELAERIFRVTGFNPELKIEPAPVGSVDRRCPDLEKIKRLVNYAPKVDLEEGLKRTWEWYKKDLKI